MSRSKTTTPPSQSVARCRMRVVRQPASPPTPNDPHRTGVSLGASGILSLARQKLCEIRDNAKVSRGGWVLSVVDWHPNPPWCASSWLLFLRSIGTSALGALCLSHEP